MKGIRAASVGVALIAAAVTRPAYAAEQAFDVSAGPLGVVAGQIGAQAGITVMVPDPVLARRRSPGVRGRMSLRRALDRALAGTGAKAQIFDRALIRIVLARPEPRRPVIPKARVVRPPAEPAAPNPDIVVTAIKQRSPLDRYPGTVKVVEGAVGWANRHGADGIAALTRMMPAVSATNLGQGREKVFIRGIADSSFTGPTQAATAQYLGDVRLTYNAPDPALDVHDLRQIEVLVGPQAPLYGAGSLGGVIRLVPNVPDPDRIAGNVGGNVASTRYGGLSAEGAAMVNLPLVDGRLALRVVVSGANRAGYIDAPAQGRSNINASRAHGHRIAVRGRDVFGWTLDIGHVAQIIRSDTGQYVQKGDDRLVRDEPVVQPFASDYRLLYLTASRAIAGVEVVSTSALVRHRLTAIADAVALAGTPLVFVDANRITIVSQETRLSGGGHRSPWVVGGSLIHSDSVVSRLLAPPVGEALRVDTLTRNLDLGLFGQVTQPVTDRLSGTIGARITYARNSARISFPIVQPAAPSSNRAARFTRTIGLDWRASPTLSAFFRHDQGYRAGGLTAYPTLSGLVSQRYRPDTLDMYELGVRVGDLDRSRLSLRASVFTAQWRNMQADLVDGVGLSYTDNVGDGILGGVDAELRWRFSSDLLLTASAFLNDSRLANACTAMPQAEEQTLPNVAKAGGRLGVDWEKAVGNGLEVSGDAAIRYVGASRLGVGSVLNVPQGDFAVADIGGRIAWGRLSLSLRIDNLTDTRGNTFAYGNPFTVARRDQVTPLRPRTLRLGVDFSF